VSDISWRPEDLKPENAAAIEAAIEDVARGGTVRLTLVESGWKVRALLPAAMCARGASASDRDVSDKVAELLIDHGCPVASAR
jgi:hypothetical protein